MSRIPKAMLAMAVGVAACSSNSRNTETTTYSVQVTSVPPSTTAVSTAVPISVVVNKQVNGGRRCPPAGSRRHSALPPAAAQSHRPLRQTAAMDQPRRSEPS